MKSLFSADCKVRITRAQNRRLSGKAKYHISAGFKFSINRGQNRRSF